MENDKRINFYENIFRRPGSYAEKGLVKKPFPETLNDFIEKYDLKSKKILEIGSNKGFFQNVVPDYTGLDIIEGLSRYYHKPYVVVQDSQYPFPDGTFDAVFSRATFEHIPDLEKAVEETLRVLKSGGVWLFYPAWHVRPWAPRGYAVKAYGDLDIKGKLVKFSIIWRGTLLYRTTITFFKRIFWTVKYLVNKSSFKNKMPRKKLEANYDEFLCADSDACNSMDPYAAVLFFKRHNCKTLNYPNLLKAFLIRSDLLVIRKK